MIRGMLVTATLVLLLAVPASAGQSSATFQVKLTIAPGCTLVAGGDIVFDTVPFGAAAAADKATTISVTCSTNSAYQIAFAGANDDPESRGASKNMKGAGSTRIAYRLINPTNQTALGSDTNPSSGNSLNGVATSSAAKQYSIAAHITGSVRVQPDTYSDQVIMTINF